MRRRLFICAFLIGGLHVPAVAAPAQPPAGQVKVDPAALQAADRMLTAMGYERMMKQTCDAMIAPMGAMFRKAIEAKTGEAADDALIKQLTDIESEFLRGTLTNSPALRRAVATLYASEFSAAELNHLAELYADPVMHEWTEVAPDMTAKMLPLIHGVTDAHRSELEQKLAAAISSYYTAKQGPKS